MKFDTSILIIGFGSIGQRHYRNLLSLGFTNIAAYDLDSLKLADVLPERRVAQLTQKIVKQFGVILVCSPTHLHITHVRLALLAGAHVFIEKPLSHTLRGLTDLTRLARAKKLITMVGCNMRFHPCLQFVKRYLEEKKLGAVYSMRHEFGSYLPSWRPTQDYRKNYAAKKSTGGGIILDDIHEFDLLFWLNDFSRVKKQFLLAQHTGALEIKTEDAVLGGFLFANGVLGEVHADYLSQHYRRSVVVIGERGNLSWNFNENIVWFEIKEAREKLFEIKDFDFNEVYKEELQYFLKCIDCHDATFNDVACAARLLKHLLS